MKAISFEEMKSLELQMLKYIKKICEENDIQYFLCAGTLLGAVRHQGFIPWDDDIDIALPRQEFEKLLSILRKEQIYNLIDPHADNCYYPFAKICDKRTELRENIYPYIDGMGVYIDIFPLDGFPEDEVERMLFTREINSIWYNVLACYTDREELKKLPVMKAFKRICKSILCKIFGRKYWKSKLYKAMTKYPYDSSKYVGYGFTQYLDKFVHNRKYYSSSVKLLFEDEYFSAPAMWNDYLTDLYHDYMQFPPAEKQVTHHEYEVYWK